MKLNNMRKLILDSEVPEYPSEVIEDAPKQGRFDDYADYLVESFEIEADHEMIRCCLKGFGAWTEQQLQEDEANVKKFLWLTILNAKEAVR